MDIYFRQQWKDPRLSSDLSNETLVLGHSYFQDIWVPDTFVTNAKESKVHTLSVPNILIRLSPDGTVLLSERYVLYSYTMLKSLTFHYIKILPVYRGCCCLLAVMRLGYFAGYHFTSSGHITLCS